jgi:hypothetical protein
MSFVFDIAAGQAANATGKYNQAVQNRNATIAEQEAAMVEKQLEFEANFARIQGQLARQQGKQAQLAYFAKAGQSLMAMSGGAGGGTNTAQLNMAYPAQYGTF